MQPSCHTIKPCGRAENPRRNIPRFMEFCTMLLPLMDRSSGKTFSGSMKCASQTHDMPPLLFVLHCFDVPIMPVVICSARLNLFVFAVCVIAKQPCSTLNVVNTRVRQGKFTGKRRFSWNARALACAHVWKRFSLLPTTFRL